MLPSCDLFMTMRRSTGVIVGRPAVAALALKILLELGDGDDPSGRFYDEFEFPWSRIVSAFRCANRNNEAIRPASSGEAGPAKRAALVSRTESIVFVKCCCR